MTRTAKDLTYIALGLFAGWGGAGDAAMPSHPEPAPSDLREETPEPAAELRERVSRDVAVAVGRSDVRSSRLRNDAIRALAKPLSEDDVRALSWFLDEKFSQQDEYDVLTFNALKNDVLGVLLERVPPPEGIGQSLVRMFRDPDHDDVWRDYCVQHFAGYYRTRRLAGAAAADRELLAIESAYWEAVAASNSTTAGTALIGLRQQRIRTAAASALKRMEHRRPGRGM